MTRQKGAQFIQNCDHRFAVGTESGCGQRQQQTIPFRLDGGSQGRLIGAGGSAQNSLAQRAGEAVLGTFVNGAVDPPHPSPGDGLDQGCGLWMGREDGAQDLVPLDQAFERRAYGAGLVHSLDSRQPPNRRGKLSVLLRPNGNLLRRTGKSRQSNHPTYPPEKQRLPDHSSIT